MGPRRDGGPRKAVSNADLRGFMGARMKGEANKQLENCSF